MISHSETLKYNYYVHWKAMNNLLKILSQFAMISNHIKIELMKMVVQKNLSKGELLLEQGNICKHIYILEHGLARGFYYKDTKDITSWFAFESDILTSLYSFVSQKPSFENIEILENSIVYGISYKQLQELYQKYPEFNMIGRLITEKYYIGLEERILSMQYQTAKERYKKLLENNPQLLQRASLGHIASYIGVSQETLSRIRTKI
jgi:CRP/FNR family transcriptional regulator, anaerobic regulatory protein